MSSPPPACHILDLHLHVQPDDAADLEWLSIKEARRARDAHALSAQAELQEHVLHDPTTTIISGLQAYYRVPAGTLARAQTTMSIRQAVIALTNLGLAFSWERLLEQRRDVGNHCLVLRPYARVYAAVLIHVVNRMLVLGGAPAAAQLAASMLGCAVIA